MDTDLVRAHVAVAGIGSLSVRALFLGIEPTAARELVQGIAIGNGTRGDGGHRGLSGHAVTREGIAILMARGVEKGIAPVQARDLYVGLVHVVARGSIGVSAFFGRTS